MRRVNVGTMLAAMFYRGVDIDKTNNMSYRELKTYYEFHEAIENEYKKQMDAVKK
jgi:hypothetical protein